MNEKLAGRKKKKTTYRPAVATIISDRAFFFINLWPLVTSDMMQHNKTNTS